MSSASVGHEAVSYDIGERFGAILRLRIAPLPKPTVGKGAKETNNNLGLIVVLDKSGSMGASVNAIVTKVIPAVCEKLHIGEKDEIDLITFESNQEHVRMTVPYLRASSMCSAGGTSMGGAIDLVSKVLCDNPTKAYRIIVISDGEISDGKSVLQKAVQLESKLAAAQRTAPLRICLVRALTSARANPDTKALACLGQLNTGGATMPSDVAMFNSVPYEVDNMISTIMESFKGVMENTTFCTISCGDTPAFMRLPGAAPQTSLQLSEGESFVLLAAGADLSRMTVDDQHIEVKQEILKEEESILPLLVYLESQVKQLMVIGSDARAKEILDWVGILSSQLFPIDEETAPSIVARRNALLKAVSIRSRSVVQRLRALANVDKVSDLNSQRQAEFLRGVTTTSQGKALARRAAKVDSGDIEDVIHTEVVRLRKAVQKSPLEEKRADLVSFYGHDTFPGILNGLTSLTEDDLDAFSVAEIMQIVGPLGFSFLARQTDAPDPWSNFRVDNVFLGESTYLNSADLWTSRIQGGGIKSLLIAPGTKDAITGVVPVRHLHPEAFDLLEVNAPTLLNLHVAASLRGSLVCMPGDAAAMTVSCAIQLARSLSISPSQVAAENLYALLSDVHHHKEKGRFNFGKQLIDGFNSSDPRPFLAGDIFVASGLKPLAAVLSGMVSPSPALARAILGYGFYISAGRKYRDPQDRKDALVNILSIRSEHEVDPGAPGTPDPVSPAFPQELERASLYQLAGLAPEFDADTIRAAYIAAIAFQNDAPMGQTEFLSSFKKLLKDTSENRLSIFGTTTKQEEDDLVGVLAVQAIRSPELSSRVRVTDTEREYKFPDVWSSDEIEKYLASEISKEYANRYQIALKRKRTEEEAIKCSSLIDSLVKSPSVKEFIEIINKVDQPPVISSRSSPGYSKLIDALLDRSRSGVPDRMMKLWVLILGRDRNGEIVWNSGNVLREDLRPYYEIFAELDPKGEIWEELKNVHSQNSCHVYRASDSPNRHGHCNSFPSWWARGYSSPDAFKAAAPEEFQQYVAERKKRSSHRPSWMLKL